MQVLEGPVLKFPVSRIQTQAMGDGGIDIQCFAGNSFPLGARCIAQRSHIVDAVCKLNQDDANVACHGQQHFAERLRLVFFPGVELQLFQLGQAIDQFGNGCAEALNQLRLGDFAVFNGIMEQSCHERLGIQFPFGALLGDRDGVGDVGLAAVPQLPQMGLIGKAVGLTDTFNICCVQIVEFCGKCSKAGGSGVGCSRGGCPGRDGRMKCVHASNVS